jgi:hypothetical protein
MPAFKISDIDPINQRIAIRADKAALHRHTTLATAQREVVSPKVIDRAGGRYALQQEVIFVGK